MTVPTISHRGHPPAQRRAATGCARASGTCGELVQGRFKEGRDFLITLPIDLHAEAQATLTDDDRIVVWPPGKVKSAQAARLALDALGHPHRGVRIAIASALPVGKGMASSTADIVATCRAVASATGATLSPEQISRIAAQIEPSDGLMYEGCVSYDHRRCELLEMLGPCPPATLLVVDLGGWVDTVAFNHREKGYTEAELEAMAVAYQLAVRGIRQQRLSLLGQAATISARINQRLLPKPELEALVTMTGELGAHGVCVAHSGTVAGILFDKGNQQGVRTAKEVIWEEIDPTLTLFMTSTCGEGR